MAALAVLVWGVASPAAASAPAASAPAASAPAASAPVASVARSGRPRPMQVAPASDSLRVFLLTFGQGEAVWERFGHNALWIHDPVGGTDVAYHYGLFDMSESGFLTRFLQGRMFYSMGAADAGRLLEAYRRAGRSATLQELRLTQEQARELQAFLDWNMLPGNRGYRYDYFRDNCSTRVRDALDDVLDGALSSALRSRATPITYRSEALSLTAEDVLLMAGMDVGLGPLADTDLTRWDLAFIPMRLRDDVRDLTIPRGDTRVPLVVEERRIPALGAPDEELAVRTGRLDVRVFWMLLAGVVLGGVVAGLGWWARTDPPARPGRRGRSTARLALGALGSAWGLVTGVLGLILLALWLLTDHEFAHRNENLLQANPLALGLVVLAPLAAAGRATRAALLLAAALVAFSLFGLLLHPLPVTPQANLGIIALALPVHLALAWALWQRARPRP